MDRNCRIWNKCKLLPIGGDARVLERLSYCVELIVGSGNNILLLLGCQLLGTSFQGELENTVFVNGTPGNRNPPFFVKHVGNASAAGEVPVVPGKDAADFGGRAVLVVSRGLDDDRHAARGVTFVNDFVEMLRFHSFACPALDRAVDDIVWRTLGPRRNDRAAEPRVAGRVAAASLGRDRDLASELAEKRRAFCVDRTLGVLNFGPLAVSRHAMGIL